MEAKEMQKLQPEIRLKNERATEGSPLMVNDRIRSR
jgi:hypothetical protein